MFDLPDDVSYLDAASWSLLPTTVRAAGEIGLLTKSQPWTHPREQVPAWAERARTAAAGLIGAQADDVAIVGSISHAVATVARNLAPARGTRVLRVADEFPSLCLAFDRLAIERGLVVEEIARPADGDWTVALLEAIQRPGATPLAVATLTPLHWTDGTLIDLERLAPAVRAAGATLVVDATQAVGAVPVDVARLRPDFLAFPTYKWALGPYSLAFLYVAAHLQNGTPIEEHNGNHGASGARRFDKSELNDPVALPMAATAMELIADWGVPRVAARLRELTDLLAAGAAALELEMPPRVCRVPHVLGARMANLPEGIIERLRARNVFVSARSGGLRISPHVWTKEADIKRCLAELQSIVREN